MRRRSPPSGFRCRLCPYLRLHGESSLPLLAQMRSADRIDLRLSLEAKRKTFTRDECFAF
jgi:hypothetical protein